jgi:peptidoglycan/xylan/chitin deacetylase (PgdA/CDA1 family)
LVHACPQLKARNMKALVFLATEILETPAPQWWQDMLVRVLDNPPQAQLLLQKLGMPEHYAQHRTRDSDHEIAGRVAALPLQERLELLAAFVVPPAADRQMLTQEEVRAADRRCIEFGAHGHTHAPLTAVAEAEAELRRSHALVTALDPAVASMSFPHGAYTDEIVEQTEAAGFSLVFTSDPVLLDMKRPGRGRRIGRIHVPENEWTTEAGRISFPRLATFLFFRPRASS